MWSPFLHPPKKAFLSPSVWPRRQYTWKLNVRDSLEDKSMLVHFKKAFPLTSLDTHLKEELTAYCFVSKV